jgi:hypothetical protein
MDRQDSPYRRGNLYDVMPIPMVKEACIPIDAGPVQLVVESRKLTNAILEETYKGQVPEGHVEFDDYGPTLHVCGTVDGLEHLRFDCFEHEPHYHYIRNREQSNVICRIDEVAVGDPIEFTLRCVRLQLPQMLELAGADALAAEARAAEATIHTALDRAAELMAKAR